MSGTKTNFTPIRARDFDSGFRVAAEAFELAAKGGADDDVLCGLLTILVREHKVACAVELAGRRAEGRA